VRAARHLVLIDNMIAAVDIKSFASDEPRCIVGQERSSNAYIVNTDETSCRGFRFRLIEQDVKLRNSRCGPCRERSR